MTHKQFGKTDLQEPSGPNHGLNLAAMAGRFADEFAATKKARKGVGADVQAIPGVHHPIFRNQTINKDPREVFLSQLFKERGESNVFHDFYSALVQALYEHGVTPNVFCVNIDSVIAAFENPLAPISLGRILRGSPGECCLYSLPFRTHGRLRRRDRRSHQPRAQHGYAHAGIAMLLCRVIKA